MPLPVKASHRIGTSMGRYIINPHIKHQRHQESFLLLFGAVRAEGGARGL